MATTREELRAASSEIVELGRYPGGSLIETSTFSQAHHRIFEILRPWSGAGNGLAGPGMLKGQGVGMEHLPGSSVVGLRF